MGVGPIDAIPKVLEQFGLKKEDIDLWEVGSFAQNLQISSLTNALLDQRGFCVAIRLLR